MPSMGLEVVELLLATEQHFQISIPDAHTVEMTTVGDLQGLG